jgi:hypothetical protein
LSALDLAEALLEQIRSVVEQKQEAKSKSNPSSLARRRTENPAGGGAAARLRAMKQTRKP